jgi:hypothetical protein
MSNSDLDYLVAAAKSGKLTLGDVVVEQVRRAFVGVTTMTPEQRGLLRALIASTQKAVEPPSPPAARESPDRGRDCRQ